MRGTPCLIVASDSLNMATEEFTMSTLEREVMNHFDWKIKPNHLWTDDYISISLLNKYKFLIYQVNDVLGDWF